MTNDPAIAWLAERNPQALECSIIYLKEKLEYAAESFDGSATYNMKQAHRIQFLITSLCVFLILPVKLNYSSHDASTDIFITIFCFILLIQMLFSKYLSYKASWLAHAHAAVTIKGIEAEVTLEESKIERIKQTNIEEFYEKYQSVYDKSNEILQSKKYTDFKQLNSHSGGSFQY